MPFNWLPGTFSLFKSTGLRLSPASLLEGIRAGEGSFLRRSGSFGGRSKITQTFTSGTFYPQALCLTHYSFSIFPIFQSWSGFGVIPSFLSTLHANSMIPQP